MDLFLPAAIVSGLGLFFGIGLAYASKKFEVKVDEKILRVREALPGANCGACGETGCDGFAEGIVEGRCKVNGCPVGGKDTANKVAEIMGVEAGPGEETTARVLCSGSYDKCLNKFAYDGIKSCTGAANLHGGPSACSYGCLGLGDCLKGCAFGAIEIVNGVARINEDKCTSCGICVATCPKKLIKMVPKVNIYTVSCSSYHKGAVVRKACSVGCIGCTKCMKVCPSGAITMKGPLAEINQKICNNCGECIKVCPSNSIRRYFNSENARMVRAAK